MIQNAWQDGTAKGEFKTEQTEHPKHLFQAIQTSKVISNIFLGICRTPVSPSSPEIQIQGLAVNIEPPSFLLGTINIWYGITANTRRNYTSEIKDSYVTSLMKRRGER